MMAEYNYPPEWTNFTGGTPQVIVIDKGLVERIKSIRNQCDMFLMLCGSNDADRVIATLLEDLHYRSQLIMDEYCKEQ